MSFLPTPYGVRRKWSYVCGWVSFPFLRKLNERYSNITKIKQLDFPKICPHKTLSRAHKKHTHMHAHPQHHACIPPSYVSLIISCRTIALLDVLLSFPTNNDDDIPIHSKVKEKRKRPVRCTLQEFANCKESSHPVAGA